MSEGFHGSDRCGTFWPMRRCIVAATVGFCACVAAHQALAVGLPPRWEESVVLIEAARIRGQTCPPNPRKTTTNSADKSTPLESKQPDHCPSATGFLMQICGMSLVFSNRHVFESAEKINRPIFMRVQNVRGEHVRLPIGRKWHHHPDDAVDVGASLVDIPKGTSQKDLKLTFFNEDRDRTAEKPTSFLLKIEDLRAGDDILLVGFPSAIPAIQEILEVEDRPLLRAGIISMVLPGETVIGRQSRRNVFLVDSWAFQGNSGSPVFSRPSFLRYGDDRSNVNFNRPYIVGVVSSFLNWDAGIRPLATRGEVATTNAGLAVVQAADAIEEVAAVFPEAVCPPTHSREGKQENAPALPPSS